MWGLFSGLCYSHQARAVKTERCFTAATPWGIQTSAQTGLISLCLSVHFPSVLLMTLAPLPPLPLSSPPQKSDVSETTQYSVLLLSKQKHSIWCLDSAPVCHLPGRPACLHLDWPHNESWEPLNHVGPDVPPQVKAKHLVTDCLSLCLAAVQQILTHELSWTPGHHPMPC